jgi:hypothetical protein
VLDPIPESAPHRPAAVPATRGAALAIALAALDGLAELGEDVADEWTYVTALAEAGRARLRTAAGPDPAAALASDRGAAVAAAADEAARIADPHRAIDWLSTFPAVVELALVVEPTSPAAPPAGSSGPTAGSSGPAAGSSGPTVGAA